MSAEPITVTTTEAWAGWESRVVNGVFPLQRFLGGSDHSAVFLTECRSRGVSQAAIKLIPANTLRVADQLAQWRAIAALSHPNLVRIYEFGRCQIGGRELLFVVTEYAEQTLAQVLARRALRADEVRELLRPALEALAFMHQKGIVHSRLKPSNLLAVDDQLKLTADTARRTGAPASGVVGASVYDAPELRGGETIAANDIWSLGATTVEALTQSVPVWADSTRETVRLPASLPVSFAGIVRRCLAKEPANRPTTHELLSPYKSSRPIQVQVVTTPLPPVQEEPAFLETSSPRSSSVVYLSLFAIAGAFVLFLVVWAALRSPA